MVSDWIPQPVGHRGNAPDFAGEDSTSHTHMLKPTLETQEEKLIQAPGIPKTIREEIEQKQNQYAIKVRYQKMHKNRSIFMKHHLMPFKMLNPEVQILQCQVRNWRLVGRRRTDREELSKERTSLYMGSQRGGCMHGAASSRGWMCRHGAAKQGTDYLVPQLPWKRPYVHVQSSSTTGRRVSAEAQSSVQPTKPLCEAG